MRINLPRMLAIGAVGVALAGIAVTPAQAAPGGNGQKEVLAFAGSDTILDVMNKLTANYTGDAAANPDGDTVVNIPTLPNASDPGFPVAAQGPCPARTYVNKGVANPGGTPPTFPAPNGSSDGKAALQGVPSPPWDSNNITDQCLDGARSSSGPSASDPSSFHYFGFAQDAVSWASFTGGAAPATLTQQQVRQIYSCTFRNWNQVGGANAPIVRYLPQAGSGTLAFFISSWLGGATPPETCPDGTTLKRMEENHGNTVAAADRLNAILPHSVAQWIAQGNKVVTDTRAGVKVNTETGVANPILGTEGAFSPNPAVIFEGSPVNWVRTVFNVLDDRMGSFGQAEHFAGDNGDGLPSGYLCSGATKVTSVLTQYGFSPFGDDGSGNFCRQG